VDQVDLIHGYDFQHQCFPGQNIQLIWPSRIGFSLRYGDCCRWANETSTSVSSSRSLVSRKLSASPAEMAMHLDRATNPAATEEVSGRPSLNWPVPGVARRVRTAHREALFGLTEYLTQIYHQHDAWTSNLACQAVSLSLIQRDQNQE
jgi:hypothetical protein